MKYKSILILTDNEYLYSKVNELIPGKFAMTDLDRVHFRFSHNNTKFIEKYLSNDFSALNVKTDCDKITEEYDLIFSLHCKQLFPEKLVNAVTCVNVHPGFNPYNRGWFPQIFSILNGMPIGATIHIMDKQLDHGPIIAQQQLPIHPWDTSLTLYNRILDLELDLLKKNIVPIITGNFKTVTPKEDGNMNSKSDFDKLQELDKDRVDTFENFINYLRALTHGDHKNCFFYDKDGNKIYIRVLLEKEKKNEP